MTGSTFAVLSVTSFRFQLVTRTSKQSVFPYMFMRTVSVCHLPSLHCHFLFLSDRTSKVFVHRHAPPASHQSPLLGGLPTTSKAFSVRGKEQLCLSLAFRGRHTIFCGLCLPTSQSDRISSVDWDSTHPRLQASGHLLATIF